MTLNQKADSFLFLAPPPLASSRSNLGTFQAEHEGIRLRRRLRKYYSR